MSVKSLTVVLDDDGRDICVLLRTLDGHLTGHGADLRAFLRGYVITRESRCLENRQTVPTIGRLTPFLIVEFTAGIGDFELLPSGTRDIGEEYIYSVYSHHTTPTIPSLLNLRIEMVFPHDAAIEPRNVVLYDGLLDEFDPHHTLSQWSHDQDEPNHITDNPVEQSRAAGAGTHKTQ